MSNLKDITDATSQTAQYDTQAKWLLGNKDILANILVRSVDDFKGMEPSEVVKLIEGEPHISSVPVDEGHTNKVESGASPGNMITGMNNENNVNNEGKLSFDVIFYVRTPDGLSKVIVNIEAQKSKPSGYDIEMRGVFYSARMISSQKEREFTESSYNDIKKVYSIWICMNTNSISMNHIHLTSDNLVGCSRWNPMYDVMNIVIINLPKKLASKETKYQLHRLLGAIFLPNVSTEEKENILENEFHIKLNNTERKELNSMCNLGEGILEMGIERGLEQGTKIGEKNTITKTIKILQKLGLSENEIISQIREQFNLTDKEIQELLN